MSESDGITPWETCWKDVGGKHGACALQKIGRLEADLAAANATISELRAERERLSAPVSDFSWQCNECGSDEYASSVSEQDIEKLTCGECGANEFHKVKRRAERKT